MIASRKTPSSVLAIALEKDHLQAALVRRSNGSLSVAQSLSVPLALNPFAGDPQLVGREIRNHLEQAGIRERRCAVSLPFSSALFLLVEIPEIPEDDVASFLEIEMERGFPYGQDALYTAIRRFRSTSGKQYAAAAAISRNEVAQLEQALRAAQLRLVTLSFGLSALQAPGSEATEPILAIGVGENTLDLQISADGGIIALRSLDEAFEFDGQKSISADFLAREVRITLGQLPPEYREKVRHARLYGRGEIVRGLISEIRPRLQAGGLRLEWVEQYSGSEFPKRLPAQSPISAPVSVAASHLSGLAPAFELLPPKVHPWKQLTARVSSRKLVWAGAAAACVLALVGGAFGIQRWQLSRLQARWTEIEPEVRDLETLQQHIKTFRPWFDESFRSLNILTRLTEAFPDEGIVTARTVEIRDLSIVTCSGVAQDNQAFLNMLDRLRNMKEVGDLKVDQVRGKTPMQFTFNFQWREANEN